MAATRIGVTGPDRGGTMAWLMTALAVRRCGGVPVRISPSRPCDEQALDGIIIGGGTDVDPLHYGQARPLDEESDADKRSDSGASLVLDWLVSITLGLLRLILSSPSPQDYDPDRDRLEQHLIRHALYNDLPILGICRGAQLMNVVLGGTLHQSIEHFYTEGTGNIRSILPRKAIDLVADSRLRTMLGVDSCRVNALHDQSIDTLGDDLVISAREPTGVVQAIECTARPFFIGVQWHPEYMPQSSFQLSLFRELLNCAGHARAV